MADPNAAGSSSSPSPRLAKPGTAAEAIDAARYDVERDNVALGSDDAGEVDVIAATLLYLAILLSLVLLGFGVYFFSKGQLPVLLGIGALATLLSLMALGVARTIRRGASQTAEVEAQVARSLSPVLQLVQEQARLLARIESNTLLSERGKQVAYRDRDREAIRRAIDDDLLQGDFTSARQLADEFEQTFGYKDEADRIREMIRQRLKDHREHEIEDSGALVDRLCREERWNDAFSEADKLIGRYGSDMQVRLLRTRIEERRQQKKVELVKQFHDARYRHDHDAASDLLHRLDLYLTPEEGRQLAESAREVFKGKLINLRDRFTSAMHRHDFSDALRIGETIKREFPNSQLASEVRKHEPQIREAAGVAPEEESPV